jgi:hypothetical protein
MRLEIWPVYGAFALWMAIKKMLPKNYPIQLALVEPTA